jgi:hypothetical protein
MITMDYYTYVNTFLLYLKKFYLFIISYLHYEIWYFINKHRVEEKFSKDPKGQINDSKESSLLILYVHGLNGSPRRAYFDLNKLQKKYPLALVLSPYLPNKCNIKLNTCADLILELIELYRLKYPNNKICLIGYSYGALVVNYVENNLKEIDNISIAYIAGPFKGTRLINILDKTGLLYLLNKTKLVYYHKDVIDNLRYDDKKIVNFNDKIPKYFAYSDMDERVFPYQLFNSTNSITVCHENYSHKTLLHIIWPDIIKNVISI